MTTFGPPVTDATTAASYVVVALAVVAMVVDWWSVAADRRRVEYVAKPAVMVFLAFLPWTFTGDPGAYRVWIVIGLVFGLVGDVFLMLDRFIPGAAAFLVGHLAYLVAILPLRHPAPALGLGVVIAIAALATLGRCIARGAWQRNRTLGVIVAVYMVTIGAVVAFGVGTEYWTLVAGTLLFGISDTLLGWGRFVGHAIGGRVAVHVTYHLGQLLIAASVAQVALR